MPAPTRARRLLGLIFLCLAPVAALAQAPPPPPPPPPLPPPPVPAENPITEPKRVLGKILFWDEQLSSDDAIACGTCHLPRSAGADPRRGFHPGSDEVFGTPDDVLASPGVALRDPDGIPLDHAIFGRSRQVTGRAAQAIIGTQYAPDQFWDGRARGFFNDPDTGARLIPFGGGLESQAVGPILSSVEMAREGRTWPEVTAKLAAVRPLALATNLPPDMAQAVATRPSYPQLFAAAFGDDEITAARIAFAIATYERTLVPNQSPWDRFNAGNPNAMTPQQRAGWNAFQPSPCAGCHRPPQFSDQVFHNIGLRPWQEDVGRMEVTGNFGDRGNFKTPALRNLALRETFMHTGALGSLEQVLDFYQELNGQQQFPDGRAPALPIVLPPNTVPDIIEFLRNGLTDPRVAAGTFPFDRPTLRSELPAEPLVQFDPASNGSTRLAITPGDGDALVEGYRVFRGTFPLQGTELRPLGARGSGFLAAYDHGELDCGLLPVSSDFTAELAEPGSFYFLVGAVGNGTCAGLGFACLPLPDGGNDCSLGRPHPVVNCAPCGP